MPDHDETQVFLLPANLLADDPLPPEAEEGNEPREQRGHGDLDVASAPSIWTSETGIRAARWHEGGILTCTTHHGRNLRVGPFDFTVWSDGRWKFETLQFRNVSRHSSWEVSLFVTAIFDSGHVVEDVNQVRVGHVDFIAQGTTRQFMSTGTHAPFVERFDVLVSTETYWRFRIKGVRFA